MEPKNMKIKIGEKLKKARLSCGYTQENICEKLGCTPRYISQIENNKSLGSIPTILKLCNLYGMTLNELYSDYLISQNKTFDDVSAITGYFKLNNDNRYVVDNIISIFNQLQNK